MDVYQTEEEQVESMKKWWSENSRAILLGVSVALIGTFGWQNWQSSQQIHAIEASDLYQQLIVTVEAANNEKTIQLADKINASYGDTPYGALASLHKAKIQVTTGDRKAAVVTLEKVAQSTDSNSSVKHVAQLRALRIRLGNGDAAAVVSDIEAIQQGEFVGKYAELKGDAYQSLGKLQEARTAYVLAMQSATQEQRLIQQKLDNLGAPATKGFASQVAK